VVVGSDCYIGARVVFVRENGLGTLVIGDSVQIGENCRIDYTGGVVVGDNALLSAHVHIYSHDHAYDPRSTPAARELVIERDAWIGAHVLVLPSTERIGRGAIVGAGSVVTRPVPDGAIVAGNPAQFLKMREL
jgi:acetyltransferase-like isoleucine patch superfamily enzyme